MLLIDTYNVLHTSGVLPPDLAGLDAPALADLIAASRYADRAAKLVCDGARSNKGTAHRRPGIEFLYAGPGREADELIERIIQANSAPRRLLVVSSDRRVTGAARRRGAATLPSGTFLAQLAADRSRPRRAPLPAFTQDIPLDPYSVAEWMREFGLDPSDVDSLKSLLAARAPRPSPPVPKPDQSPVRVPRTTPAPDPAPPPITDPVLLAALQEWAGRISLDDLDMNKWLGDSRPTRPARPLPPRGRGRRAGG